MADIEYWKQRARDAEAKVKELGGKVGDTTRRAVDMGKAKVGVDLESPVKDQIKEGAGKAVDTVRRGVDMGKAKAREEAGDMADFFKGIGPGVKRGAEMGAAAAGADLNEPLAPQIGGAGRGQGANDLEALFLDNVMGGGKPDPYMYQGAPPEPPAGPSMYETPQLNRPQPGQGVEPPAMPPGTPQSMYEATPPSMMQAGRQMAGQAGRQGGQAMEQALRAAEEAFNNVMQRFGGGAPPVQGPPTHPGYDGSTFPPAQSQIQGPPRPPHTYPPESQIQGPPHQPPYMYGR